MKSQKGITLVALIITIIVMLILVAVSVTVLIQSGLFESAKEAGKQTQNAYEEEAEMNKANINGQDVDLSDLENYVKQNILGD